MGLDTTPLFYVLLGVTACLMGVYSNMSFPPGLSNGLHRNNSIQESIYLTFLKKKIQAELEKYRGNVTQSNEPLLPGVVLESGSDRPRKPEDPTTLLLSSGSPGKNLLSFPLQKVNNPDESKVTRVNLWIHIWQKERKRKKQTRRKKKGKLIRISVYNNSSEDDVIATLRTRIHETQWFRISLPISLVSEMKSDKNGTIVLRVECKRCNRRTKLLLPQKSKCKLNKRKKKKKRRNNRKRQNRKPKSLGKSRKGCATARNSSRYPFLVVEQKYKSYDRKKRSLTCNPADLIYRNGTVTSNRCCRMSTYIDFSDMDLEDVIVTPAGYEASRCVGRCPRNRNRNSQRRNGRRNRNRRPRGGERPRRGKCRAVQTGPLTVWLFDRSHNLVEAKLPDLVVRNCDCR